MIGRSDPAGERAERVQELFLAAADLGEKERAALLEEQCAGDESLRQEVLELLNADSRTSGLFESSVPDRAFTVTPASLPFERIGPYEVLELLGTGGMGVVYLGRQENPRRNVALKVMRPELASDAVRKRFEREGQALGRLQHPGIAQIYEAGTATAPSGPVPFFAMEHIDGRSITDHVAGRKFSLDEVLGLFIEVCDAVDHAHDRGVLHRDLKPSNVMIDRDGRAKVLDFGIARLAEEETGWSRTTETGGVVGTLSCMSPEQVDPTRGSLDRRSDVYALGALLYEILSGRPPLDFSGISLVQAARLISDAEPLPVSTLVPSVPADLDTIIAKAMAKEPVRRYGSARALRDDVERLLEHRPIQARPPSTFYQMRKAARRHRGLVAGLGVAFVVLIGGLVATTVALLRARTAEDVTARSLAELEAENEKVVAVKRLLEIVLASPHPENEGRGIRVLDALDRALEMDETEELLAQNSEVSSLVESTVGQLYTMLGQYEKGEVYLDSAIAALTEHGSATDPEVLQARKSLAMALSRSGRLQEARENLEEVLELSTETLGPTHEGTLITANNLAAVKLRQGVVGDAFEAEMWERLEVSRQLLGPENTTTLTACNNLALYLDRQGRLDESAELFEDALPRLEKVLGPRNPKTLTTLANLARVRYYQGDMEEADAMATEALAIREEVLGPMHTDTGESLNLLGQIRREQGRFEESIQLHERCLEVLDGASVERDTRYAAAINNLATVVSAYQGPGPAEPLFRQNLELMREIHPIDHPDTLVAQYSLALNQQRLGNLDEALALYEDVLQKAEEGLGEDDWRRGVFALGMGRCLLDAGMDDQAWPFLERAHEVLDATFGPDHGNTQAAAHLLEGRPEAAR